MRNYSFTAGNSFAINAGWSDETFKTVRSTVVTALYILFQTEPEARQLKNCTASERRVLVAFRHWLRSIRSYHHARPFVYVNVNTGRSIVLTVSTGKTGLVDPRFIAWEDLNIKFNPYGVII